jgi:hypothetical protein
MFIPSLGFETERIAPGTRADDQKGKWRKRLTNRTAMQKPGTIELPPRPLGCFRAALRLRPCQASAFNFD